MLIIDDFGLDAMDAVESYCSGNCDPDVAGSRVVSPHRRRPPSGGATWMSNHWPA
jgi:hypothetical protein